MTPDPCMLVAPVTTISLDMKLRRVLRRFEGVT